LLKAVKDLSDPLGWLRKHGFDWDAHTDVAPLFESACVISDLQKVCNDLSIVRELAYGFIDIILDFLAFLTELLIS
jgi:hypothetical protein